MKLWKSSTSASSEVASTHPKLHRLLIVSHVPHFQWDRLLYAYGPYAREIEVWAELFAEVVIAAPLRLEVPPGDALALGRPNISVAPQLETGGDALLDKAIQALALPRHLWRLAKAMRQADAIHVRCPGNLGLLGCLLAPPFGKPCVAKYAGQWSDYPGEPRAWRWQKALLRSRWWRGPVLVYGQWPNQPPQVVPFFASVMDDAQMARARSALPRDWSRRPLEVLFVGRLSSQKNVDVILRALALLKPEGLCPRFRVVGDGPLRRELEGLARALKLDDQVTFQGAVPQTKVLDYYEQAHMLVLASQTEGWPKAIAEAMAFGMVCVGANRGLVPQMLGEGRGLLVEPGDAYALAARLRQVAADASEAPGIAERAAAWARPFTLEAMKAALRQQLESSWNVPLPFQLTPGLKQT
jgi:glycosyltransferase involved in cell wall biosynthesis